MSETVNSILNKTFSEVQVTLDKSAAMFKIGNLTPYEYVQVLLGVMDVVQMYKENIECR